MNDNQKCTVFRVRMDSSDRVVADNNNLTPVLGKYAGWSSDELFYEFILSDIFAGDL